MTKDHLHLMERFYTKCIGGDGWKAAGFRAMDGVTTAEALWPLNARYMLDFEQIRSVPFDARFAPEADAALEMLADDIEWTVGNISAGAWRVMLERQLQSISVALLNHLHGNENVVLVPDDFPSSHRTAAAALWLQYAMELPLPVQNLSTFEWPASLQHHTLIRH